MKKMAPRLLVVDLGLNASNADIIHQMRVMKSAREGSFYNHVCCAIRGFDQDNRELWKIPEVRAFCVRLVTLGFLSFLDPFTSIPDAGVPEICSGLWGSLEVWLASEGRMKDDFVFDIEILDELNDMLSSQNEIADKAVGPFKSE